MSSLPMQVYLLQHKCSFHVKSKAQIFFLATVSLGDLRSRRVSSYIMVRAALSL